VVASDSALEVRDTVPTGWVTFRMVNEGTRHHSFRLRKLPEDKTFKDFQRAVLLPADSLEKALVEGRIDSASYRWELRATIPEWLANETRLVGGITGLASERTAQITHNLEPGHYALSCFFQTPGHRLHVFLGVRAGLQVTENSPGAPEPTADLTARLSPQTFDVASSALSDEQTIAFRSTGGPEPMPAGDVAHVRVGDLPPGRYAWITEEAPDTTGVAKTFAVEDA